MVIRILLGAALLSIPRYGALGSSGSLVFVGPVSSLELLLVLIALLFVICLDLPWNRLRAVAPFVAAIVIVFELACCCFGITGATSPLVPLLERVLYALSLAVWFTCLPCGNVLEMQPCHDTVSGKGRRREAARIACAIVLPLASGFAWLLSQYVVRIACADWGMHLDIMLTCATFAWALELHAVYCGLGLSSRDAHALCLVTFLGMFLANRFWFGATQLGLSAFELAVGAPPAQMLSIAPLSALLALVSIYLLGTSSSEDAEVLTGEVARRELTAPSSRALEQIDGYEDLTLQEKRVLALSLEGKSAKEIGSDLGISPSTIGTYRTRAYQKLGVSSYQDIVRRIRDSVTGGLGVSLKREASLVPDEPVEDESLRHPALRQIRYVGRKVVPSLILITGFVAIRLVGGGWFSGTVSGVVFFSLAGLGSRAFLSGKANCSEKTYSAARRSLIVALCGFSTGASLALLSVCPQIYLLPCSLCTFVLVALVSLRAMRHRDWYEDRVGEGLLVVGLTGLAFVPIEPASEIAANVPIPLYSALLACLVAARMLERAEMSEVMSSVADLVLVGDERVRSYLVGRGANKLQSEVALLTAHGFDLSHIAEALYLSTATVSNYRTKVYRALGVHSRRELVELLEREAGFAPFDGGDE